MHYATGFHLDKLMIKSRYRNSSVIFPRQWWAVCCRCRRSQMPLDEILACLCARRFSVCVHPISFLRGMSHCFARLRFPLSLFFLFWFAFFFVFDFGVWWLHLFCLFVCLFSVFCGVTFVCLFGLRFLLSVCSDFCMFTVFPSIFILRIFTYPPFIYNSNASFLRFCIYFLNHRLSPGITSALLRILVYSSHFFLFLLPHPFERALILSRGAHRTPTSIIYCLCSRVS